MTVSLETWLRGVMTEIYNRGHSGLDHDCPLCQAYIACDRLLAWEIGCAPSDEVRSWDRSAAVVSLDHAGAIERAAGGRG